MSAARDLINIEAWIALMIRNAPARRPWSHPLVRILVSVQFERAMELITEESLA